MSSVTKILLSGSTGGKPIKVAASSTPGTTVHTAVTGTSNIDLVYLWVSNTDTTNRIVTVEFGGVTSPDHHIVVTVPASSTMQVLDGQPIQDSLITKVYADAANVVTAFGYVNRII